MTDAIGMQMIEQIHDFLKIDSEWTEWHDDGFTWWAHDLAQRFRFEGPRDVEGIPTYWLTFETEVARDLPRCSKEIRALVAADNGANRLFETALVEDRLVFRGRTYALPETAASRVRLIANQAIVANVFASKRVGSYVSALRRLAGPASQIEPAFSSHPANGSRLERDEMLSVVDQVHLPEGLVPVAPAQAPDLGQVAKLVSHADVVATLSADEQQLTVEFPNDAQKLVLRLSYRDRHPVMGNGLSVSLVLPLVAGFNSDLAGSLADALNNVEWKAPTTIVTSGAWVAAGTGAEDDPLRLEHKVFYPNLNLKARAADNVLTDAFHRSRLIYAITQSAGGREAAA